MQETGPVTPQPPEKPINKPVKSEKPVKPLSKADQKLLDSPFAKMFAKSGAPVTAKEIKMIIDNLLKQVIQQMKQTDKEWKETQERMKRMLEGKE